MIGAARDRAGDQIDPGALQLVGHRGARFGTQERQRRAFGHHDRHLDVSWPRASASPAVMIASSYAGNGHTAPGGTTIASRLE